MDVHIGINQILAVLGLVSIIVALFVGAAWGKRIGMKGGTIKGSTINAAEDVTGNAIAKLEAEIKALKEKS